MSNRFVLTIAYFIVGYLLVDEEEEEDQIDPAAVFDKTIMPG